MKFRLMILLIPALVAGCMFGPKYQRPAIPLPDKFQGASASMVDSSIADLKWSEVFHDETLKQLITTALEQNLDVRMAAERIQEARAQFRIVRASQYPAISGVAQFTANRPSLIGSSKVAPTVTTLDTSYTQAGGLLSWELDVWGRLRRLSEAAKAEYLATEDARQGVIVSMIADVADNYFQLREQDQELEIARSTRDTAKDSLRLVNLRHDRGAASGLDVHQAEQLLYTATAKIARIDGDIAESENTLSLLLGQAPGHIMRGEAIHEFKFSDSIPSGLPSSLLERRPDIRRSEQALISANAQIGVAKSYYFPQITLTGVVEGQSRALTELFTGPARLFNFTSSALVPIFSLGKERARVRLTEAQKRELAIAYQKAVYNALREVSNSLVRYDQTREQINQQEMLVKALSETSRLSKLRYQGGKDSYLQVLDAERNLFQGQISLSQLRLQGILSFIQVYRALGGGWQ
jgi:NodT family efflux transporter outer membrane factor (OMF) lipoprotein